MSAALQSGSRAPAPLLLAGPTASGKSAVALELAAAMPGEIVSADSMQVYAGMDLGTAKPTPAERARVPHHLLDLVDPSEPFNAARWLALARAAHAEIAGRGRTTILCGGTGLYFRAWLRGLDEVPPVPPEVRAALEATPLSVLLAELADRDPRTYATVDRRNPRRVIRALEVLRGTGSPLGDRRREGGGGPGGPVVVLRRDAGDLRRRIEARVEAMFAGGLVEETRALLRRGLSLNRTATQAIGYRQVLEFFEGGRDLAATIALVKTKTWQYARRQMTWFRHQLPVRWCDVAEGESAATVAARVRAMLEGAD